MPLVNARLARLGICCTEKKKKEKDEEDEEDEDEDEADKPPHRSVSPPTKARCTAAVEERGATKQMQFDLAWKLFHGIGGITKDRQGAARMFRRAAQRNHVKAHSSKV